MLQQSNLRDYQVAAHAHMMQHPKSMIWMGCGLGKTAVTLTTIINRMAAGDVRKTLIFGPLRVIHAVWAREAAKWAHTKHLTFSMITGTPNARHKAMDTDADIYLINYENMNWLTEELNRRYIGQTLPYQMVVYDEVSKMKNSQTVRMKGGLRQKRDARDVSYKVKVHGWREVFDRFPYTTGLTGTPASNGYIDLFGQYLVVDQGERLGTSITAYQNSYFASDFMGWKYTPTDIGKTLIEQKISDITIKMDAKDYVDLPDCKINNIMVEMPPKARKYYDEIEAQMFTELESGTDVEVFSRASVSNKCLQICNGSPYTDLDGTWEKVHDAKLDALEGILEEAAGQPVLCSYTFKSDAKRIMQRFKKYRPVNLTAEKASKTPQIIEDWNTGKIKLLIGHPASMGHGIDGLQDSGSIVVWFGLNWSLELYDQLNLRIDRDGQKSPVVIHRILCRDTLDLAVADSLMLRQSDQEGLKKSIQRYRDGLVSEEGELSFL